MITLTVPIYSVVMLVAVLIVLGFAIGVLFAMLSEITGDRKFDKRNTR